MNSWPNYFQQLVLFGAFTCVCLGTVALVIVWGCARHYHKARLWDRYAKACGGQDRAVEVLRLAEAMEVEQEKATDLRMRAGFQAIQDSIRTH